MALHHVFYHALDGEADVAVPHATLQAALDPFGALCLLLEVFSIFRNRDTHNVVLILAVV